MSNANGTVVADKVADAGQGTAADIPAGKGKGKPAAAPGTAGKSGKLYALMGKGAKRTFTLSRETDDGLTYRFSIKGGLPKTLDPAGVRALARDTGGKTGVSGDIGAADGKGGSVLAGADAAEYVTELTAE